MSNLKEINGFKSIAEKFEDMGYLDLVKTDTYLSAKSPRTGHRITAKYFEKYGWNVCNHTDKGITKELVSDLNECVANTDAYILAFSRKGALVADQFSKTINGALALVEVFGKAA